MASSGRPAGKAEYGGTSRTADLIAVVGSPERQVATNLRPPFFGSVSAAEQNRTEWNSNRIFRPYRRALKDRGGTDPRHVQHAAACPLKDAQR